MNIIKALKRAINSNPDILKDYAGLSDEKRRMFVDDITVAISERLRVLSLCN